MSCVNCTREISELKDNLDSFFLLANGILILLMQPGFALLECGSVRSKNATNILIKNMLDAFLAGVAFWLVGYAFAFGKGNCFLGTHYFATYELKETNFAQWFFQYVFAATAATIVSGSMAERCDAIAYFVYSTVITGFIYPVIVHWTWTDEGWLRLGDGTTRYRDFAGSGVVHLTGGTCALIGAIFLGPRIGRFGPTANGIRGHSVPLSITGGMILLVGFLAFNGGSQGSISKPGDGVVVARAVCHTTISGCFGGLVTLMLVRAGVLGKPKVLSAIHSMNGALTGMVAICAGVDAVTMWGAALTGAVAGVVYLITHILVIKAKIDDPIDAIAVHLGGGIWGLLAGPIFRVDDGILLSWNRNSGFNMLWNLVGLAAIFTWSAVLSAIMFGLLKKFKLLRVSAEIETRGLDLCKHNEPAYPADGWFEEQYQDLTRRGSRRISITPYDISLPPFMRAAKRSLDNIHEEGTNMRGIGNDAFISDRVKSNKDSTNF
uniref:Ammonium transporter n=1 Tax=Strigamia maritima TaxID=126957 RepID=T1JHB7_STRMM